WHAVEFSRNGRFLRTHPLGLSSGRFPSVFRVSSLADPISVSATRWSRLPIGFGFRVFLFGDSDSIRSHSTDRIGFICFEW
ncbi:hypothetical protein, partial [Streptomyces hundungensis]|uniref:hypothetical protein n=1 Tax=Streptomyces hundungensis TaxID=1077946 RepID=UPI0033C530BF